MSLEQRIAAVNAQIDAYETAVLALAQGGVQSYELDTGQSKQRVTKFDIDKLNNIIDSLYNRLWVLETRLNGGSTTVGGPAF